jgi:hypothetical protein
MQPRFEMHEPNMVFAFLPVLIVLFIWLISTVVIIIAWWRIFSKMGFPGVLSLLNLIPIVSFFLPIVFAFIEWPIEKELEAYKRSQHQGAYPSSQQQPPQPPDQQGMNP